MNTPQLTRENISDTIEGITVNDPYRKLEQGQEPDVQAWVQEQNKRTDAFLDPDLRKKYAKELTDYFHIVSFTNPVPVRGKYFYQERQPNEDQMVLYVKDGHGGSPRVLMNPNGLKKDNTITIDYWQTSRTGTYLSYGTSEGGNEMATLYVKKVETGELLPEVIPHARHASVAWLADDSGFYYTKNPWPGTVPADEEHLHTKVYFHALGTDPKNDELIFGKDRPKDDMMTLSLSPDNAYLAIHVMKKWTENEIYILDIKSKTVRPLVTGIPSKFHIIFLESKIVLITNYKANNNRVLQASYENLYAPIDTWKELIPEKPYLLDSIRVTKSKILADYLVNASSEVIVLDYDGKLLGKLPILPYSSIDGITTNKEEEEFFFGVSSFTFPKILYRYDPEKNDYIEFRKVENPINPDDFVTKQEWYTSKDGTSVPMFIVHKKDLALNGSHPTILYGYGGFASTETPGFMRQWLPWFSRGGIFAIANIRGGGEFGESWHLAGVKEKKIKSYEDFIAAAEHLISKKYTSSDNLGILGGSNGGLLVAAVSVMRPDLFKAVGSRVPLTDMVRFPKFGIAMRWVHEYGDPLKKEELKNILTWSPYHNVQENVTYPYYLFTTGNNDSRVDPFHARKMTAMLQSVEKEPRTYLYTEFDVGHGSGKPVSKFIESQSLMLTFFSQLLGMV
jgi:prolyl oligopeptidase